MEEESKTDLDKEREELLIQVKSVMIVVEFSRQQYCGTELLGLTRTGMHHGSEYGSRGGFGSGSNIKWN